jgi:tRNA modification GTPase
VTPIPGTTRDRVSETLQIEGVPLHITDTAGLRSDAEAADEVERIGIQRSWQAIAGADVVIFLHDLARVGDAGYETADALIRAQLPEGVPRLQVYNKADVAGGPGAALPAGALKLSARTGEGLDALRQALLAQAGWQAAPEGLFIARTRHVQALQRAREHLLQAQAQAALRDAALDLLAEELRLAHRALGEITGQFSTEDLLGVIFSSFCIGK